MAKSRPFSIYLLKLGYDAATALKEDHRLDEPVASQNLPTDASLLVLDSAPTPPWWREYFGVQKKLDQSSKGALVFLPVDGRVFALSFGHVHHNLREESYEYDFGLRVTLNCVDPDKIKNTDTLEPGAARRMRTQVSVDSDLTYFDFDRDSSVLKSLTGKVKSKHSNLIKHVTGSSNLRVSSSAGPSKLVELCTELLALYKSDEYKTSFPDIQNIVPVRDPSMLDRLNEELLAGVHDRSDKLYLAVPDLVNYADNTYVGFGGAGKSERYDDVYLNRYYEYLTQNAVDLGELTTADLVRHELQLVNEDGQRRSSYSIFKSLIFEVELEGDDSIFHLTEGTWYRVDHDYVAKLRDYLDPFCSELGLPDCAHHREDDYNSSVAEDPDYVCLDRKNISPGGQTQIEPCDIYAIENGHPVLIHVKISTASSTLSHLFNQGVNAASLLRSDTEAVEKLVELVRSGAAAGREDAMSSAIDPEKLKIVFGIITHKDHAAKSNNLPLFSRISLMRNLKALHLMRVPATYGFITDVSPARSGTKKKRKPRTKKTPSFA